MRNKYLSYSILLFLAFVALGILIRDSLFLQKIDISSLKFLQKSCLCGSYQTFWKIMTFIGSKKAFITLSSFFLLLFLFLKKKLYALIFASSLVFSEIIKELFKLAFARKRPNFDQLTGVSSKFSFPSGHTLLFLVLLFLIALPLLLSSKRKWLKYLIIFFWLALSLAEGLSRICLGVHWPLDILGSFLLGGAIIALGLLPIFRFYPPEKNKNQSYREDERI